MQIQWWEGAALSRAETVLQSTTQDTVRAEIGYGEKVSQRRWSKMLEEGIGLTAGHRSCAAPGRTRRVFELERVVSCCNADRWWRTRRVEFRQAVSLSMTFIGPPHLEQRQEIREVFGGRGVLSGLRRLCRTQQLKAKRQERGAHVCGWPRSRNAGCARNLAGEYAVRSGTRIH